MWCVYVVFFFFFLKEKTAYERKECDWSSDVCSSDLEQLAIQANVLADRLFTIEQPLDDLVVHEYDRCPGLVLGFREVASRRDVSSRHIEPIRRIAGQRNTWQFSIGKLHAGRS